MKNHPRSIQSLWLLALLVLCSCSNVYSPYLHLPDKPLRAGQSEVLLSAGALPYAYPSFFNVATGGGEMLARTAVTDALTLQARAWSTTGSLQSLRIDGVSLETISMLTHDTTSEYRFAIMPRLLVTMDGIRVDGGGVTTSLALWTPPVLGLDPYIAIGAIAGTQQWESGPYNTTQTAWGIGTVANLGASWPIWQTWVLHGEFANTILYNSYSNSAYWVIVPEISISATF